MTLTLGGCFCASCTGYWIKICLLFVLVFAFFLCVCVRVCHKRSSTLTTDRKVLLSCAVASAVFLNLETFFFACQLFYSLSVSHTHINVRCRALHVVPAFAEVVSEVAQRSDAQFLPEFRVLFLFGPQNLPECIHLFFQLDTQKKTKSCFTCPFTGSVLATFHPSERTFMCEHTLVSSCWISSLSSSVITQMFRLTSDAKSSSASLSGSESRKPVWNNHTWWNVYWSAYKTLKEKHI